MTSLCRYYDLRDKVVVYIKAGDLGGLKHGQIMAYIDPLHDCELNPGLDITRYPIGMHMLKVYGHIIVPRSEIVELRKSMDANIAYKDTFDERRTIVDWTALKQLDGLSNIDERWLSKDSIDPITLPTVRIPTTTATAESIGDRNAISSGNYTYGTAGDYATLNAAMADMETSGALSLTLTALSNTTESAGAVTPGGNDYTGTLTIDGQKKTHSFEIGNENAINLSITNGATFTAQHIYAVITSTTASSRRGIFNASNNNNNGNGATTSFKWCRANANDGALSNGYYACYYDGCSASTTFNCYMCIAKDSDHVAGDGSGGYYMASTGSTTNIEGLVCDDCKEAMNTQQQTITVKNCVIINAATRNWVNGEAANCTALNCASDKAWVASNQGGTDTSCQTSLTVADIFENTDITDWTDGYKLKTTGALYRNGTSFTLDEYMNGRTVATGLESIGAMGVQEVNVTLINPDEGPDTGGTAATITLDYGGENATVTLNGIAAAVGASSNTSMSITSSAGIAGTGDVVVTSIDGISDTLVNGWTYTSSGDLPTSDDLQDLPWTSTYFSFDPDWKKPISHLFQLTREINSYPGTLHSIYKPTSACPLAVEAGFTNLSKDEEHDLWDFFYDRHGRLERFWLPAWQTQYTLVTDIAVGSSNVYIRDINFRNAFNGHERIYIRTTSGYFITRQVIAAELDSDDVEKLTVATPFSDSIPVSIVRNMGRFILCRFDSDTLEVNHITNEHSNIAMKFLELVGDYDTEPISS